LNLNFAGEVDFTDMHFDNESSSISKLCRWLFLSILLGGIVASLVQIVLTHGKAFQTMYFHDQLNTFADLFNIIPKPGYGGANLYTEQSTIYPPMAYIISGLFGNFLLPDELSNLLYLDLRNTQLGLMLPLLYTLFCVLPLFYMLYRKMPGKEIGKIIFPLTMVFSAPFLYLLERGNILLFTLVLICVFMVGQQSGNRLLREISLLSLALAASIKIYPAVLGLTLLFEKRYKEAIRCVIYGILLFFVPFLFFGGFSSVKLLLDNLTAYSQGDFLKSTGIGFRADYTAILALLTLFTHGTAVLGRSVAASTLLPMTIMLLGSSFLLEKNWKKVLCLTIFMVAVPSFSYTYTLVFFALPVLLYLQEPSHRKIDFIYAVLFAGLFIPLAFGEKQFFPFFDTGYPLTLSVFVQMISELLLILMLGAEGLIKIVATVRRHRSTFSIVCTAGAATVILWGGFAAGRDILVHQKNMDSEVFAPIQQLFQTANVKENDAEYITEYGDYVPHRLRVAQSGIIANNLTSSAQELIEYLSHDDRVLLMSDASKKRLENKLGEGAFWNTLSKMYNLYSVQKGFFLFTPNRITAKKQEQLITFSLPEEGYETEEEIYWCANDFSLRIVNPYTTETPIQLNFSALPSVWEEKNTFALQFGKKQSQSFVFSKDWASFSADISLKPGVNEVAFHTTTEADPNSISDIERYFALSDIAIRLHTQ
jgi:hypothetical protein